jgi:hypothetical protein
MKALTGGNEQNTRITQGTPGKQQEKGDAK